MVAVSADSLDFIGKEIQTMFGRIKIKNTEKPAHTEVDYVKNPGDLQRIIYIVPQNDINCLRLFFPTPDVQKQYKKAVSFREKIRSALSSEAARRI